MVYEDDKLLTDDGQADERSYEKILFCIVSMLEKVTNKAKGSQQVTFIHTE